MTRAIFSMCQCFNNYDKNYVSMCLCVYTYDLNYVFFLSMCLHERLELYFLCVYVFTCMTRTNFFYVSMSTVIFMTRTIFSICICLQLHA